jgi:hypothetical protein
MKVYPSVTIMTITGGLVEAWLILKTFRVPVLFL